MLDQSFSADNLRIILDLENRKGIHVEDKLSMSSIRRINEDIKECNSQIKIKKKEEDFSALAALYELKKTLREQKEIELKSQLDLISNRISSKSFNVELTKIDIPGGKPIYIAPKTPEHFFAIKQIQRNISRLYGVKQTDRSSIVEQVILLLGDKFPKYVIRTDIKDFYESIPHEQLFDKINSDNLLTPFSRNVLRSIFNSFKLKASSNKGVPRGIGVSAYLTELFMRDIDDELRELKGLIYYARYVDDIILIFSPFSSERNRDYLKDVKGVIEEKYHLRMNVAKTHEFDLRGIGRNYSFDYLGYRLTFGTASVKVNMTNSKLNKYKERLDEAFKHYLNYGKVHENEARKQLVKRIRFLTGNTKLKNNKKDIIVGVYYTNRYITEFDELRALDNYLLSQINSHIRSANLKDRLLRYSFFKGFKDKKYSPFTTNELTDIMSIWKKSY